MDTTFTKFPGQGFRFILITALCLTGIHATVLPDDIFVIRDPSASDNTLTRFRGEMAKYRRIALKWQSMTGDSTSYTIEKSRDGENFAEVDSKKIRQANGEFVWMDEFPKVMNCYRLKMTEAGGHTKYSRTLVIYLPKSGNVSMVSATPDMAAKDLDVDIELKEEAMLSMLVSGTSGDVILRQVEKANPGPNHFCIRGSQDIKPGEYLLKVVANGTDVMKVRLIKE